MLFCLGGGQVPIWLRGIDCRVQTTFGLELLFERARIRVEDSEGVRARLDLPQPVAVAGYAPELVPAEHYHDDPPRLTALMWRNLADVLAGTGVPSCTGDDALAVATLLDRLREATSRHTVRRICA
jgi:hypothetical protein